MAKSKTTESSTSVDQRETDADRALRTLLPATSKFTQRLTEAIRNKDSGWHRLAVKVDRGTIRSVQVVLDEQCTVNGEA